MRQQAQNSHFRQDVLCMALISQGIQATRTAAAVKLPDVWIGHSCIGDIAFKNLDGARKFAAEIGYNGILL